MNISLFSVIVFAFFAIEIVAFPNLYKSWFGSSDESNEKDNDNDNDNNNDFDDYDYDYRSKVSDSRICQSSIVRAFYEEWPRTTSDDILIEMLSECEPSDFVMAGLSQHEALQFYYQIKRHKNGDFQTFGFVDKLRNKFRNLKAKVLYKIDSWKSYLSSESDNARNYFVRKLENADREPQLQSESEREDDLTDKSIENVQLKPDLDVNDGKEMSAIELSDELQRKSKEDNDDDEWLTKPRDEESKDPQSESKTDDLRVDYESIDFVTSNSSTTDEIFATTENQF